MLRAADFPNFEPGSIPTQGRPIPPNSIVFGSDLQQVLTRSVVDNLRALTSEVIQWVESDEYVSFAEQVETALDPRRFQVQIVLSPETRKQVIVALSRLRGIGVQAAREFLECQTPLGTNLSALDAAELAARYAVGGIPVSTNLIPPAPA